VCSVLNTVCPVSEAWMAISAVSRSRISADQDLVGVLPQDGPQALGKRVADRSVDGHLDDAVDVVFDGIFGRDQLILRRVHSLRAE